MTNDFSTVVLCGGKGERLQPLTLNHQKVMLDVQGFPFLEYVVFQIHNLGINKIIFCCGHKSEEIIKHFGTNNNGFINKYSCPINFLSTGARLISALTHIKTKNVIVFNGDSICNIEPEIFWEIYERFNKSDSQICKILVDKKNSLLSSFIGNKSDYFGAGIYFIKTKLLKKLECHDKLSLENNIINDHFDKTVFVKLPENFLVIDIGTPQNLEIVKNKETRHGALINSYGRWINEYKTKMYD